MRKIVFCGVIVIVIGFVLILYSIIQTGSFDMADPYPTKRGLLILGFVMMAGGGLIALSPFGKK